MEIASHYDTGQVHWSWLSYSVPDHLWIDVWRYAIVILCFFALGSAARYVIRVHPKTLAHIMSVTINSLLAVFIILQEVQQFGKPMLVWRLPYETFLLGAVWYSIVLSHSQRAEGQDNGR